MKRSYRGFEIEAHRDASITGEPHLYFSVIRQTDGWIMIDSFEEGGSGETDTVYDMIAALKASVDDYHRSPEDWEDEE